MPEYQMESHECCIQGKRFSVVNLTPEYQWEEREAAKKAVKRQLYEIFCKYLTNETETNGAALE